LSFISLIAFFVQTLVRTLFDHFIQSLQANKDKRPQITTHHPHFLYTPANPPNYTMRTGKLDKERAIQKLANHIGNLRIPNPPNPTQDTKLAEAWLEELYAGQK
jgi:hypothetical protein